MDEMHAWEERTRKRLRSRLQRDVPLAVREYRRHGGPSEEDYARVRNYATDLGAYGDIILYPDGKGSEEPHLQKLVDGVAVLSFCPSGVRLYGLTFDAACMKDEQQDELRELITYFDRLLTM